jgi:hypothetical protein
MALDLQPPSERKRVKVYELKENDWFDRGTGFCTGRIQDVSFYLATQFIAWHDRDIWHHHHPFNFPGAKGRQLFLRRKTSCFEQAR